MIPVQFFRRQEIRNQITVLLHEFFYLLAAYRRSCEIIPRFIEGGLVIEFAQMWKKSSVDVKEWFLYFGQLIRSDVNMKISQAKVKAVLIAFFWYERLPIHSEKAVNIGLFPNIFSTEEGSISLPLTFLLNKVDILNWNSLRSRSASICSLV